MNISEQPWSARIYVFARRDNYIHFEFGVLVENMSIIEDERTCLYGRFCGVDRKEERL